MTLIRLEQLYLIYFNDWDDKKRPKCDIYPIPDTYKVLIIFDHIKWNQFKYKKMLKKFISHSKEEKSAYVHLEICFKSKKKSFRKEALNDKSHYS